MYIMIQCFPNSAKGNRKFYRKGAGFPIGGGMGGGGGVLPHPMNFFEKNPPPLLKTNAPHGVHPPHLKMKSPHLKNNPPPPPLKREAPFHDEMIPRKSTINNNLKSS